MKKKKVLIGLASLMGLLTAASSACASTMFYYGGYVNSALGLTGGQQATDGESMRFKSKYGDLNRENCERLVNDEIAHGIKTMEEGAVLLKNDNCCLPLASNERSITFFGNSVKDPVYRTNAGQASYSDKYGGSLKEAFKNAGFDINETMFSAYENSGVSRSASTQTGKSSIGEVDISFYTDELKSSFESKYNDAAIVLLTRFAGEGVDLDCIGDVDGLPSLALHQQEKDLLKMIKNSGKFKKTIVLINSPFAMDAKWLEDSEYGVDAAVAFGAAGDCGFIGIANLLTGQCDFSGRLSDTWAANSLSSAAMQNFGDFSYTNVSGLHSKSYVVYQEGIYVGYKYYETRYQDQVLNRNNASGNYGCYESGTSWDYAKEMAYTFGYGLSYSDMKQELVSVKWDKENKKVTAEVKVTNNGSSDYSGASSSVVQLYAQLPYDSSMAEKSAVQLIGYARTGDIEQGKSETVTVSVDDYSFATYDENAENGADLTEKGCYVFDKGDYYFAIGNNSHDALNNILAKQNVNGLFDADGNAVSGDAAKASKETLSSLDNMTYAKNPTTGEIVYNHMEKANLNYYGDNLVTYMTRNDWSTFPSPYTGLIATDQMITDLKGEYYKKDDSVSISDLTYGTDADIKLVDLADAAYDDEQWDTFISQISMGDLCNIIGDDRGSVAIPDLGKPANSVTNGPNGVAGNYVSGTNGTCMLYPDEVTLCNTFDDSLAEARGEFFAEDMLYSGFSWMFGPGNNTHRTPYAGRNSEYYSEEPVIAYNMTKLMCTIMTKKGIITGCKHFAINDQETNRHGISTFIDEQTARQVYLKSFEGALTDGAGLGVMTSFNRVGCIASPSCASIQTDILRNEWGFKGVNITDSAKDASDYFLLRECLTAGTDLFLSDTSRRSELSSYIRTEKDGGLLKTAQTCNKHFYYALSRSIAMNGLTKETVIKKTVYWWKPTIISLTAALGAGTLAFLTMGIIASSKKKEEKPND